MDADALIAKNKELPIGYYRKAAALRQLDKIEEGMSLIQAQPQKIQDDPMIKQILNELQKDYKEDHFLPNGIPCSITKQKIIRR